MRVRKTSFPFDHCTYRTPCSLSIGLADHSARSLLCSWIIARGLWLPETLSPFLLLGRLRSHREHEERPEAVLESWLFCPLLRWVRRSASECMWSLKLSSTPVTKETVRFFCRHRPVCIRIVINLTRIILTVLKVAPVGPRRTAKPTGRSCFPNASLLPIMDDTLAFSRCVISATLRRLGTNEAGLQRRTLRCQTGGRSGGPVDWHRGRPA